MKKRERQSQRSVQRLIRRRLTLRLTTPPLEAEYYHAQSRKRSVLDLPKAEFIKDLWPGRGLTWAEACDLGTTAKTIKRPGTVKVCCGEFLITARYTNA